MSTNLYIKSGCFAVSLPYAGIVRANAQGIISVSDYDYSAAINLGCTPILNGPTGVVGPTGPTGATSGTRPW